MFGTWQSIENPTHIIHITQEKDSSYIADGDIKQKVEIENRFIRRHLPSEPPSGETPYLYRRIRTTKLSEDCVIYGKHLPKQEKPEHFRRIY